MVLFGNKTVTVFNRFFDVSTEEEIWFPTVLSNVNLVVTNGANITKSGIADADKAKLFIDENSCKEKSFILPRHWKGLSINEKELFYTFQEEDFFVEGDYSSQTLTEDFYQWMVNNNDNVFRVTTLDIYEDVMPHMEIGGK